MVMGDTVKVGGSSADQAYERLVYECTVQRTQLERRLEEMERRIEILKRENASLKAQIRDLEKSTAGDVHGPRKLGTLGRRMVF